MLFIATSICLLNMVSYSKTVSKTVDLNSDGKKEEIILKFSDDGDYMLQINNVKLKGELDGGGSGCVLKIVDIDKRDHYKEIEVYTEGPSDDFASNLYTWDGAKIIETAQLGGWLDYNGTGIVYTHGWTGFWERTDKFVFDSKTHKLIFKPAELYFMRDSGGGKPKPTEGTVVKTFPLYKERNEKTVLANLEPKSRVSVIAYSPTNEKAKNVYEQAGCISYKPTQGFWDGFGPTIFIRI